MSSLGLHERFGVALGLLGLAEALVAAAFAPHVPWLVRAGRIAVDLVLAAGFVAYLRGDRAKLGPPHPLRRLVGIVLVLAGGVFALTAPGIDPWRRAFRAALGLALAAGIALGVGRTVPATWLRRARVLTVAFVLVEFVVTLAATLEIDAPVAVAGLAPAGRAMTARLDNDGYAVPPPVAAALVRAAPQALALRRGHVVATARLADTLHLLHDDPVPGVARLLVDPGARAQWFRGDIEGCTFARAIRPPATGYREPQFAAAVAETLRDCAPVRGRV